MGFEIEVTENPLGRSAALRCGSEYPIATLTQMFSRGNRYLLPVIELYQFFIASESFDEVMKGLTSIASLNLQWQADAKAHSTCLKQEEAQ